MRTTQPRRPVSQLLARAVASSLALAGFIAPTAAQAQANTSAATRTDLEEIVVTARKREENIQDVPISISLVAGDRLEAMGITKLTGIEYQVPGLMLGNRGFDGASIGLRGASSIRGYTGDQAAVAVHLDGVYLPQSGQALGRPFDVERIEVLMGPQGSLYGRNAVAGVINVISRGPADEFEGSAQASYGSRDAYRAQGAVSLPFAEGHGLRIAGTIGRSDGYVENTLDNRTFGDDDFEGGRLHYEGKFADFLEATAVLQYMKDTSTEAIQPARLNDPANGTAGIRFFETAVNTPVSTDREDLNFSLTLDFDIGFATLRSVSGYSDYSRDQVGDTTMSDTPTPVEPFRAEQSSKGYSQELQLFSTGDNRIDWRAGLYYMKEEVDETRFQNEIDSPFANGLTGYDDFVLSQDGEAKAVFGALDFHFTDSLTLSVGGRYNDEEKTQMQDETWGIAVPTAPVLDCSATGGGALFCNSRDEQTYTWSGPSGDVSLNWQLSSNRLLYARAARGFRSGAVGGVIGLDNGLDQLFFGPGTFPLIKLDEEKLDSYEIGSKNTLLDGRLTLNATVFYQEYKNQLVFTFDPATFRLVEGNLGASEYKGIELTTSYRANDMFSFDLSALYNDSEITEIGPTAVGVRIGNVPILSPVMSMAAGVNLVFPVADGSLNFRTEYNYKDKVYFDLANRSSQDAVGLVNASLRYDHGGNNWFAFGSVTNLSDEQYLTFTPRTDAAAGPGPLISRPGQPRTWEVGLGINF